jgi:quinol monooxygenase YgiN
MKKRSPVKMLCTYRPRKGREAELLALIERHWPALHAVGLATDDAAIVYRATDKRTGRAFFVEIFSWRDDEASAVAHQTSEVRAIWQPMEDVLEKMELAVIEPVGPAR